MKTAREIAFALLCERERNDGDITQLLKAAFKKEAADLSVQDRAFVKILCNSTVERLITLDAVINRIASVKTPAMKVAVRNVLRMGACQILYLSSVPDAAAVDESVKLIRPRTSVKIAGFVNAVLRRICREKEDILKRLADPDTPLGERTSMPPYLCRLFIRERGKEETERIFAAYAERRPLCLRPDPRLAADPERYAAWERALRETLGAGVSEDPLLSELLLVSDPGDIQRLPGYQEGAFMVQDVAGVLAVKAAGIQPTDRVLDVCAAPGGKALYAAALVRDAAQVTARDVSEEKCAILKENARRMRLEKTQIQVFDATCFDPTAEEAYDVVLCDLPCTGFGVMGRKPEIRHHASASRTEALVKLQRQILDTVWRYVRPGGVLIYSTCTISRAENEENVAWFCDGHPYDAEPWLATSVPGALRGAVDHGCLTLLPGVYGTDGFFIARLRRQAEELQRGTRSS